MYFAWGDAYGSEMPIEAPQPIYVMPHLYEWTFGVKLQKENEGELKSPLHRAIERGDLRYATLLLEDGYPSTLVDNRLNTTAVLAIKAGFFDLVKFHDKETLRKPNTLDETPLTLAASIGNLKLLQWLVETLSPEVDELSWHGKTLLWLASAGGHVDCVSYLLSIGYTIGNALSEACANGHLDVVKVLLPEADDIQIAEANIRAISASQWAICEFLLSSRIADPNDPKWLPNAEEVPTITEKVVDPVGDDTDLGWTPALRTMYKNVILCCPRSTLTRRTATWKSQMMIKLMSQYLKMSEVNAKREKAGLFDVDYWRAVCDANNIELAAWMIDNGLGPDAKGYRSVHSADPREMLVRTFGNTSMHDLWKRSYPDLRIVWNDIRHEKWMFQFIDEALAAREKVHLLDWLSSILNDKYSIPTLVFECIPDERLFLMGAPALEALLARGWDPKTFPRALSLDTNNWPTKLPGNQILETLKTMSKAFQWTQVDLNQPTGDRREWLPPFDDLSPLAWAVHHGALTVVEWMVSEFKLSWEGDEMAEDEDDSSEVLLRCAFGCPYRPNTDGEHLISGVSMARYLSRVLLIPFSTRLLLVEQLVADIIIMMRDSAPHLANHVIFCYFEEHLAFLREDVPGEFTDADAAYDAYEQQLMSFDNAVSQSVEDNASALAVLKPLYWVALQMAEHMQTLPFSAAPGCFSSQASVKQSCDELISKPLVTILNLALTNLSQPEASKIASWALLQPHSPLGLIDGEALYFMDNSNTAALKWLKRHGVDLARRRAPQSKGYLMIAAERDDLPNFKYLLANGADPREDIFGSSCVDRAMSLRSPQLLQFLQSNGIM